MPTTPDSRRAKLLGLLGDLPDRDRHIHVRVVRETEHHGFRLTTLMLDLNGIEPVPAYRAVPPAGNGWDTALEVQLGLVRLWGDKPSSRHVVREDALAQVAVAAQRLMILNH